MKRYLAYGAAVLAALVLLYLLVGAAHIPLLADPGPWLSRGGLFAAAMGLALLVGDVLLPVPSILVMIALGALFGVVLGTALSLAGSVGSALLGFALGRRGGPLVARLVSPAEQARAAALLRRWGPLVLIVTRPLPLLADAAAITAGASPLNWRVVALAAALGALPQALLCAIAGATAAALRSTVLVFALVLLLAGLFWLASGWAQRRFRLHS